MPYSLTPSQAEILARLHAFLVAIFEPARAPDHISERARVASIYRWEWLAGRPLPYRGTEGVARHDAERDLRALSDAGLVERTRPKGRTTDARLTGKGFNLAARLCSECTLGEAQVRHVYKTLANLEKTNTDKRGVPEYLVDPTIAATDPKTGLEWYANTPASKTALAMLVWRSVPLLAAGLIQVRTSMIGSAYYQTVLPYPARPAPAPDIQPREDCKTAWHAAHERACRMLAAATDVEPNELGEIPVPVSG